MEESIEAIWKNGFLQKDALVAPKINDLYNQKSVDIVDKLMRMFKINLWAIAVFAAVALAASILLGFPYSGAAFCSLLTALVALGKIELNALKKVDKSVNSYQYLKDFRDWREKIMADYTKIYTFFYPALFLIIVVGIWSNLKESIAIILTHFPDADLVYGIPVWGIAGVIAITCLLAFTAGAIYCFDMNLVYGRSFKKLDEIIAEIEELRS